MPSYQLYGLTLNTEWPVDIPKGIEQNGIYFHVLPCQHEPLPDHIYKDEKGAYYRIDDYDILSFDFAEFWIQPTIITCHLKDDSKSYLVETLLLGTVLAFYIERYGAIALHGSAVNVDGSCIAFLSGVHGGKSVIASAFVHKCRCFVTDELLVVSKDAIVYPGPPIIHLWPDAVEHIFDLEPTGPGRCRLLVTTPQTTPLRLQSIYILSHGDSLHVEPVTSYKALRALVRCSYMPMVHKALNNLHNRLNALQIISDLADVKLLTYPRSYDHLDDVYDRVIANMFHMEHYGNQSNC